MTLTQTMKGYLAKMFAAGHVPAAPQMTMTCKTRWLRWVLGFTGTPSGTFTLTWKGGSATGAITYSTTSSGNDLATAIQTALNTAYGAATWTVTNLGLNANGLYNYLMVPTGASLPGGQMVGTNPTGGTTVLGCQALASGGLFGGFYNNAVVASTVDVYDSLVLPAASDLLFSIPASQPVGQVSVNGILAKGLLFVLSAASGQDLVFEASNEQ